MNTSKLIKVLFVWLFRFLLPSQYRLGRESHPVAPLRRRDGQTKRTFLIPDTKQKIYQQLDLSLQKGYNSVIWDW